MARDDGRREPGGHGERCVAVGALDMAIWDAAAKIADEPLCRHIARRRASAAPPARVPVYAGGGYLYPRDDEARLADEARACVALGFNRIKIKIGGADLDADRRRIETVLARLPTDAGLAVDAMNAYGPGSAQAAARAVRLWPVVVRGHLRPAGFRDAGGRGGQLSVADRRRRGLFSPQEARLLARHGGLRPDRDVLVFDPAHCYGLTAYVRIVEEFLARGWPARAFWPHGGHLFGLHVAAGLGLGGAELNPFAFQPFCGMAEGGRIVDGMADLPQAPGIGFEAHVGVAALLRRVFPDLRLGP